MIIIILFIIFIIYIMCRKNKILESFLERDDSKLSECSHLIENINNHFELYKKRKLSYSHPKHKTFGIMRPLLFYFWNNSVASSKNFKENIFDIPPCHSKIIVSIYSSIESFNLNGQSLLSLFTPK